MTQDEALIEIQSKFIVHEEMGERILSIGDDGKEHDTGARNLSKAPNGEPYVTVVSGGVKSQGDPVPMWFGDEGRAWRWWYYAVLDYAETIAPEADWPKLHLYWREKPEFEFEEYMSVNQAQRLQRGEPLYNLRIGVVHSRLLISKIGPDGTEGP